MRLLIDVLSCLFIQIRLDPIGHCVRLCIAEKDINVEVIFVDPDNIPEDIIGLNRTIQF